MTAFSLPFNRTSHLPRGRRQRIITALVLVGGFLWLLVPRAHGALTQHLHKEDGTIFLAEVLRDLPLLETYTGYLHLGPRLSAEVCAALPGAALAPCAAVASAGTRAALFVLINLIVDLCYPLLDPRLRTVRTARTGPAAEPLAAPATVAAGTATATEEETR